MSETPDTALTPEQEAVIRTVKRFGTTADLLLKTEPFIKNGEEFRKRLAYRILTGKEYNGDV